jgi:hypothetical protein
MDKNKIARAFAKAVGKQSIQAPAYNPEASAGWVAACGLPWLALDIQVPHLEILKEIHNVAGYFVAHRDEYNTNLGWESFCIHGKSYDATRESEFYNDLRPMTWTKEAVELMPITVNYFKNAWPCTVYDRLRIMKLSPGAIIEVHQDYQGPLRMGPINIAITQPIDCKFYIEGQGVVPFKPGSAVWLDIGRRHCVINDSDQDRYHIIVHQQIETKEFDELVLRSYNKTYGTS